MSQAAVIRNGSSGLGAVDTLTGDTGGAVGPDGANNINLITGVGLTSTGNPGTNTITFSLDTAQEGTGTTVGAVTADIITIPLGATPAAFLIEVRVAYFESTGPAGGSNLIVGTARTTGAAATVVGTPDETFNEDASLGASDVDLIASANNIIVRVTGVAGLTINWRATSIYVRSV